MSSERKEVLYNDMSAVFEPSDAISRIGDIDKWRAVRYETVDDKGVMLAALADSCSEDIYLSPKLD